MTRKPDVNMPAFDRAADILNNANAVAGDFKPGAETEDRGIGCNRAVTGGFAAGGHADPLGLPFKFSVIIHRLAETEPATLPTAAFAAIAITGDKNRRRIAGVTSPLSAAAEIRIPRPPNNRHDGKQQKRRRRQDPAANFVSSKAYLNAHLENRAVRCRKPCRPRGNEVRQTSPILP